MKRSMGFLAAMIALAGLNAQAASGHAKDTAAIQHSIKMPSAQRGKFIGSGDPNPYKHIRTPKKNQRQIRKWRRQNPHAYHSQRR